MKYDFAAIFAKNSSRPVRSYIDWQRRELVRASVILWRYIDRPNIFAAVILTRPTSAVKFAATQLLYRLRSQAGKARKTQ